MTAAEHLKKAAEILEQEAATKNKHAAFNKYLADKKTAKEKQRQGFAIAAGQLDESKVHAAFNANFARNGVPGWNLAIDKDGAKTYVIASMLGHKIVVKGRKFSHQYYSEVKQIDAAVEFLESYLASIKNAAK